MERRKIFLSIAKNIVDRDSDLREVVELCQGCSGGEHISCVDEQEDIKEGVVYICNCAKCHEK